MGNLKDIFLDEKSQISLSNVSKVLPAVQCIAFTDFSEDDLMERCAEYIANVMESVPSDSPQIQQVEFRSVNQEKSRPNSEIEDVVEEKAKALSVKGWSLNYECYGGHFHSITLKRLEYEIPTELEAKATWTPSNNEIKDDDAEVFHSKQMELTLDVDSEMMDSMSEEEKSEFAKSAVVSFWNQKNVILGTAFGIGCFILGTLAGSLRIVYHLVSDQVQAADSTVDFIVESNDEAVETVEVDSMVFPISKHQKTENLSLGERSMTEEIESKEVQQRITRMIVVERERWPDWTSQCGERLVEKVQSLLTNGEPIWEERELVIMQQFAVFLLAKYVHINSVKTLFRIHG